MNVPYSLLNLSVLWKNLLAISIKTFTHSNVKELPKEALKFNDTAELFRRNNKIKSGVNLNITLIWKNCANVELIMRGAAYQPIFGEANLVRFLTRIGPEEFRFERNKNHEIRLASESALDICYQINKNKELSNKQALIKELSDLLGKGNYFCGAWNPTICDVAVYSLLKQLQTDEFTKKVAIPQNLNDLQKRFNETVIKMYY